MSDQAEADLLDYEDDGEGCDQCGDCGGEGWVLADCFEDTCCCADPESQHGIERCHCNTKHGVSR